MQQKPWRWKSVGLKNGVPKSRAALCVFLQLKCACVFCVLPVFLYTGVCVGRFVLVVWIEYSALVTTWNQVRAVGEKGGRVNCSDKIQSHKAGTNGKRSAQLSLSTKTGFALCTIAFGLFLNRPVAVCSLSAISTSHHQPQILFCRPAPADAPGSCLILYLCS